MDKFSFIALWDVYHGLLTPTQQEITDMYFNLDLTVSEIAAEKAVSRQAVSECLKGVKKQLEEYEEKLNVCKRLTEVSLQMSFMLTDAVKWAESFKNENPSSVQEVDKLLKILHNDYSKEVESNLNKPEISALLKKYGSHKTGEE